MSSVATTSNNTDKQQPKTAKEVIAANVQSLIEQLEAGHSDALTAYLSAMSRFHNYSFGNILEIARQKPDATRVAGFWKWKELGRSVKKGEKGTLAPRQGEALSGLSSLCVRVSAQDFQGRALRGGTGPAVVGGGRRVAAGDRRGAQLLPPQRNVLDRMEQLDLSWCPVSYSGGDRKKQRLVLPSSYQGDPIEALTFFAYDCRAVVSFRPVQGWIHDSRACDGKPQRALLQHHKGHFFLQIHSGANGSG